MEIISHRGYWKDVSEKNLPIAFNRSFDLNFGTEIDLRDYNSDIVVSHDIPNYSSTKLSDFLELYRKLGKSTTIALNIKSDGIQKILKSKLEQFQISNYFVFDMSIPDTIGYQKENLNFFSRQSEHEPVPVFYDECKGIWLDAFDDIWYNNELILGHLKNRKKVTIVSPELHKRSYSEFWDKLKYDKIHLMQDVILCTDFPEDARNYFK